MGVQRQAILLAGVEASARGPAGRSLRERHRAGELSGAEPSADLAAWFGERRPGGLDAVEPGDGEGSRLFVGIVVMELAAHEGRLDAGIDAGEIHKALADAAGALRALGHDAEPALHLLWTED